MTAVKKKTARKATAKKRPATAKKGKKRPAAKKAATKKATIKKASTKKATTKKKATAKKTTAKKAAPKKQEGAKVKAAPRRERSAIGARTSVKGTGTAGATAASALGLKHICFACEAKFYDLNKPEPICPKCDANQLEAPKKASASGPRSGKRGRRGSRSMAPLLDDDEGELVETPSETENHLGLDSVESVDREDEELDDTSEEVSEPSDDDAEPQTR